MGCGIVDFKNALPGADSIFFNTVTTHHVILAQSGSKATTKRQIICNKIE